MGDVSCQVSQSVGPGASLSAKGSKLALWSKVEGKVFFFIETLILYSASRINLSAPRLKVFETNE